MVKRQVIFISTAILLFLLFGCSSDNENNYSPQMNPIPETIETPAPPPTIIQTPTETSESVIPTPSEPTVSTEVQTEPWEEAYQALLRFYAENNFISYLLHDIDMDGTPELIIIGQPKVDSSLAELVDVVYTFRDGKAVRLEYEDASGIAVFLVAARLGMTTAPNNEPGIVTFAVGPSAGSFGANLTFWRYEIEGDKLVLAAHGWMYIDLDVLHEMFDNFGRDDDWDIVSAAVEENTHWYLNGERVTEEEVLAVFAGGEDLLSMQFMPADQDS